MASLVDEHLPLGKPIRDRERPIAQPLGERLPHGHRGTCRAREATVADLRNQYRRRLQGAHGQHQSRYREQQEHKSDDGTQGPRPEVCAAAGGESLNRVRHELHEQRCWERTEDRRAQTARKLSGQERELLSCHRRGGFQRRRSRDARAQQLIDERSFALEHAPNRRRTSDCSDREDHQVADTDHQAHHQKHQRADRVDEPARNRQLSTGTESERGHNPALNLTLPVFERAWIAHGAPPSSTSPLTRVAPAPEAAWIL